MDARKLASGAAALLAGAALVRPLTRVVRRARRRVRRAPDRVGARLRYLEGRIEGMRYRLRGGHPAEDVPDDVLADRIRSSIGSLERRLDTPRVHVMVEDGVALLHGDVPGDAEHRELVDAVLGVPGVLGTVSYLHVGLLPSDTRPSEGRAVAAPSDALRALSDAAARAGAGLPHHALRAVLSTFASRVPEGEREHLLQHLPEDVRRLTSPPARAGLDAREISDVGDLVAAVQASGALYDTTDPAAVVGEVVQELRRLVPEEAEDVAAVLPPELRRLWEPEPTA